MKKCTSCSSTQLHDLTGTCVSCGSEGLIQVDEQGVEVFTLSDEPDQLVSWKEKWKLDISIASKERDNQYRNPELETVEIITLHSHPSRQVVKTLGMVKGVSDMQAGIFSLKSQQSIYESGFEFARRELAVSALALGGNAVIGVVPVINSNVPGTSTLGGGGLKSIETFVLCGTAVILD